MCVLQADNWLFHHDNAPTHTSFFTKEFLTKNNTILVPHSPDLALCNFSLFSRVRTKLKGSHFDTIEVIEAESQAVLKMTSRMHLKIAAALGTVHTRVRDHQLLT
jgi:hypothetical protein